jgi:ribulose-phosphate 3-epimerase
MKIVPAILAEGFDEFLHRLKQAESFTDYFQIDIMDGVFVPTQSFPPEKINSTATALSFEVHLMVKHPAAFMSRINSPGLKKVIFHFESDVKHLDFIEQMKQRRFNVGLAIKPETEIKRFKELAEYVDTLMFLTVDPCCYGNPFRPEVMEKIKEARFMFRNKTISADGGVSVENLGYFYDLGIDYVCVGSRIFLNGNPEENYRKFIVKLAELGYRK